MSWEVVNAALAGGTLVVIGVTAIAATIQLRHMRASNQLVALTTLLEDWQRPELQDWLRFARYELAGRLKEQRFLDSLETLDRTQHPEILLADYFEIIGACMKNGLINKALYTEAVCGPVISSYDAIKPVIAILRSKGGTRAYAYENFEYLATECKVFVKQHPEGTYPAGFPRYDAVD